MNQAFQTITRVVVLTFLVSSMAGMGLGLTFRQIITPLRNTRLILSAVLANFIIVPMLAIGIARLLRLEESLAIGLLLLGLAAGAPFMPKMVAMANGDLPLSVGLTVLLMVGTTVFLPVALPLVVKGVEVNALKIAEFLTLLMLLPLAAGLTCKERSPSLAARLRPILERISTVALALVVVLLIALNFKGVLHIFGTGAILAALLFAVLSALAGWLLAGRDAAQRTVLGLGTGLRNIPAALIVGVQNFKDPNVSVMLIVTTLVAILVLLPAARMAGRREPRGLPGDKAQANRWIDRQTNKTTKESN